MRTTAEGIRPVLAARRYDLKRLAPELARFSPQVDILANELGERIKGAAETGCRDSGSGLGIRDFELLEYRTENDLNFLVGINYLYGASLAADETQRLSLVKAAEDELLEGLSIPLILAGKEFEVYAGKINPRYDAAYDSVLKFYGGPTFIPLGECIARPEYIRPEKEFDYSCFPGNAARNERMIKPVMEQIDAIVRTEMTVGADRMTGADFSASVLGADLFRKCDVDNVSALFGIDLSFGGYFHFDADEVETGCGAARKQAEESLQRLINMNTGMSLSPVTGNFRSEKRGWYSKTASLHPGYSYDIIFELFLGKMVKP